MPPPEGSVYNKQQGNNLINYCGTKGGKGVCGFDESKFGELGGKQEAYVWICRWCNSLLKHPKTVCGCGGRVCAACRVFARFVFCFFVVLFLVWWFLFVLCVLWFVVLLCSRQAWNHSSGVINRSGIDWFWFSHILKRQKIKSQREAFYMKQVSTFTVMYPILKHPIYFGITPSQMNAPETLWTHFSATLSFDDTTLQTQSLCIDREYLFGVAKWSSPQEVKEGWHGVIAKWQNFWWLREKWNYLTDILRDYPFPHTHTHAHRSLFSPALCVHHST